MTNNMINAAVQVRFEFEYNPIAGGYSIDAEGYISYYGVRAFDEMQYHELERAVREFQQYDNHGFFNVVDGVGVLSDKPITGNDYIFIIYPTREVQLCGFKEEFRRQVKAGIIQAHPESGRIKKPFAFDSAAVADEVYRRHGSGYHGFDGLYFEDGKIIYVVTRQ